MIKKIIKYISLLIIVKKYRKLFRSFAERKILIFCNYLSFKLEERKINKRYEEKAKQLKNKKKIKIGFFTLSNLAESSNPLENIYNIFKKDELFDPIIIISPYSYLGKDYMKKTCNEAEKYFSKKKYNFFNGYDSVNDSIRDIKDSMKLDIIFFMQPYDYLCPEEYYITNFYDSLCCFTPYSYSLACNEELTFNSHSLNRFWKIFGESEIHKKLANKYAINKGRNFIGNLGYCKLDNFLDKKYQSYKWKNQSVNKKRIIWAPHHHFGSYANFEEYYNFFIEISERYFDQIQICFRPHPVLEESLIEIKNWKKEEIENYFNKWMDLKNTQISNRESYKDLFFDSDAIILDSVSFMQEYMITGSPILFLKNNETKFNAFGDEVNEKCYNAFNKEEIIDFIECVVLEGNDTKKKEREEFVKEHMIPPNNKTASENIYNYVIKEIGL